VREINEMVLRADRYKIGYPLQRATIERPGR
jgi:hypothetical protein